MRLFIFSILMLVAFTGSAQWRLQLQSGISQSLRRSSVDNISYAQKRGVHTQLRAAYYWGHLGLSAAVGYQKTDIRTGIDSLPGFPQIAQLPKTGRGQESINFLVGPEICIACGDNFKFNVGIRGGVTIPSKNTFAFGDAQPQVFVNTITSKLPFTFNAGIGGHYFVSEHFGIGIMADFHSYKVKANNRVITVGATRNTALQSSVRLLNTAASITYKF